MVGGSSSAKGTDPTRFPRVARYLASLPNGLLSFPECECKASVHREGLSHLPRSVVTDGLDSTLADYIEHPVPVSSWVPEVVNSAVFLAMADSCFADEASFLDWIEGFAVRTFRSPMYRVLMLVASPELLARGGARRWNAFHTGTEYASTIGDGGVEVTITAPRNVFDELVVRGTLRAIRAAYRASGAKDATVELARFEETSFTYRSRWAR